jgi:hypothetical protein
VAGYVTRSTRCFATPMGAKVLSLVVYSPQQFEEAG